jgi:hypothetical protein
VGLKLIVPEESIVDEEELMALILVMNNERTRRINKSKPP